MKMRIASALLVAAFLGSCVSVHPPNVRARLETTIIPSVDFRDVDVREAVVFLNSVQHAKDGRIGPVMCDPSAPVPTNTITFSAINISAWEAAQIIAHISGLWLHAYPDKVVFSKRCCPCKPGQASPHICPNLETRRYRSQDVVASFLRYQTDPKGFRPVEPGDTLDSWSTAFLAELGVKWHPGSSFTMDTNSYIITVINAPEELVSFEATVTAHDVDNGPRFERLRESQPEN